MFIVKTNNKKRILESSLKDITIFEFLKLTAESFYNRPSVLILSCAK